MIAIEHNGKTYYRSRYHWQIKVKSRPHFLRGGSEIYRRLTIEKNGPLLKALEDKFQRFITNIPPPM